ncbi:N-acetyltransferase NAT13 [Lentinula boryana]|uniref:N-acetyltransferase NAT13 n=1 Tax=Lentinula boryana TaxID=40481 RepID=A0ABQ8QTG8_9AGAR|nr:N-acetyltransferase NAT13 [Lentinula boryana]
MGPAVNARVSFSSLTPHNLGTLRKLNTVLFPISYSDRFYEDVLKPEVDEFCKLVYYNDIPVGTICCRIETKGDEFHLYLMTMGVLAVCELRYPFPEYNDSIPTKPYRSRGLGSQSLQQIIEAAKLLNKPKISKIYLHVQISNAEAKKFYEKHGFQEVGIHEKYYKKLVPRDAWIMELTIEQ